MIFVFVFVGDISHFLLKLLFSGWTVGRGRGFLGSCDHLTLAHIFDTCFLSTWLYRGPTS